MERKYRNPRNVKPAKPASPLLGHLLELADASPYTRRAISIAAGGTPGALTRVSQGFSPILAGVERLFGVLGHRLVAVPLEGTTAPVAWALRVKGSEIVDVTLDENKANSWRARGWTVSALKENDNG